MWLRLLDNGYSDMKAFDFGSNWQKFSNDLIDEDRLDQAIISLQSLLMRRDLDALSFLDVGCGTGLFSIAAHKLKAESVLGIDINPGCINVSEKNREIFIPGSTVNFIQASVLDPTSLEKLGLFDIVYAWGSLHHTGSMWEAIRLVSHCVAPGGIYVIAIYNKHFTSPFWRWIKWSYNHLPMWGQKVMGIFFGGVIYLAKYLVTRRNPLEKERGMDFWYDVIDWIGGYPYEYARPDEIIKFITPLGFKLHHDVKARVPTGCNEYIFMRT